MSSNSNAPLRKVRAPQDSSSRKVAPSPGRSTNTKGNSNRASGLDEEQTR